VRKTLVNVSNQTSTERITGAELPGSFLNPTKKEIEVMKLPRYFARRMLFSVWFFVTAIIVSAAAPERSAGAEIPFSRAKMIIEFNASANDVGVQVLLDGEPWKWVKIETPAGRTILNITSSGSLRKQGLTELFFESSEPSLDEVPLAEFLARFPEGEYEFEGMTIEGDELEGTATFTHVIPAGPVIVSPPQGNVPPVVDPNNLVIDWAPVTETITGSQAIQIVGYQVIVEQVEPRRVHSIDLPAAVTSVKIPPEFFVQPNTLHKFEVLAIEAGGNQTITEGEFVTKP